MRALECGGTCRFTGAALYCPPHPCFCAEEMMAIDVVPPIWQSILYLLFQGWSSHSPPSYEPESEFEGPGCVISQDVCLPKVLHRLWCSWCTGLGLYRVGLERNQGTMEYRLRRLWSSFVYTSWRPSLGRQWHKNLRLWHRDINIR